MIVLSALAYADRMPGLIGQKMKLQKYPCAVAVFFNQHIKMTFVIICVKKMEQEY